MILNNFSGYHKKKISKIPLKNLYLRHKAMLKSVFLENK